MMVDMFRSEGCSRSKPRSWRPKTKEEIIKNLIEAADFVTKDCTCLAFKGLDVFLGQDSIEFQPLTSDRDSLVVSKDSLIDISISHRDGFPDNMVIRTDYGGIVITLEDRDGQA